MLRCYPVGDCHSASLLNPFSLLGQVPVLEIDGLKLGQSRAIVRYLSRKYGFSGDSEAEEALVDMYGEHVRDIKDSFFKVRFAPQADRNKWYQTDLPEVSMPACAPNSTPQNMRKRTPQNAEKPAMRILEFERARTDPCPLPPFLSWTPVRKHRKSIRDTPARRIQSAADRGPLACGARCARARVHAGRARLCATD